MGTRNKLVDLNNHLFEQLERLNDEDLDEDGIEKELKRAEGMTKIAGQIIQIGELAYRTTKFNTEWRGNGNGDTLQMLEDGDNNE